jgi:hypothetical protein
MEKIRKGTTKKTAPESRVAVFFMQQGGLFRPCFFQGHGAVKHHFFPCLVVVAVGDKVTGALKLVAGFGRGILHAGLDIGTGDANDCGLRNWVKSTYSPSSPRTASGRASVKRRS